MPLSPFKKKQIEEMKEKAVRLYKQGFDTRTAAKMLKELYGLERSHTWVWEAVKEYDKKLSTPKKLTRK
jgi:transposase-like protein